MWSKWVGCDLFRFVVLWDLKDEVYHIKIYIIFFSMSVMGGKREETYVSFDEVGRDFDRVCLDTCCILGYVNAKGNMSGARDEVRSIRNVFSVVKGQDSFYITSKVADELLGEGAKRYCNRFGDQGRLSWKIRNELVNFLRERNDVLEESPVFSSTYFANAFRSSYFRCLDGADFPILDAACRYAEIGKKIRCCY